MLRFSILLGGAACVVLAAAPAFSQTTLVNTSHSNIRHPGVVAHQDPKGILGCKADQGSATGGAGSGKASISDQASGGILTKNASNTRACGKGDSKQNDANRAMEDVSTTR
jgi:hypothetical protein